jgi:hypothetical protein
MKRRLMALAGGFRAEAKQLRRSRLLVGLTLVQAVTFLVLVSVFGLTGSHVPTAVVDNDGGRLAQQWVAEMRAAHRTYGVRYMTAAQAQQALRRGDVAAVITIKRGFSQAIAHHQLIRVPFRIDNVNTDLTDDVERGIPSAAVAFARHNQLPGIRVAPAETDLVRHEADFIPYLVVSALALDAFVVAGILAATAVAREFEGRTVTGLRLAPVNPLIPLAGRIAATSMVSATAMALSALIVVVGYGVVPLHPVEMGAVLLLCVVIFSCVGAGLGALLRRTLPVAALVFGLALPLYLDSGSLEPERFDGDLIWGIGHTSPVYYAVGVLQHAVHGLYVTPEPIPLDLAALLGWAALAVGVAWLALRRGVRA